MSEAGQVEVTVGRRAQSRERTLVESEATARLDRALDRQTGELVPELDAVSLEQKHAGADALVQAACVAAHQGLEQPRLGGRGRNRHRVDRGAGAGAQPPD